MPKPTGVANGSAGGVGLELAKAAVGSVGVVVPKPTGVAPGSAGGGMLEPVGVAVWVGRLCLADSFKTDGGGSCRPSWLHTCCLLASTRAPPSNATTME
jgi:hypothetical protein